MIYRYRLDADDNIVFVCPDWLRFAAENAAPELTEATVIGQPIWRYLDGVDCQEVFRALGASVRDTGTKAMYRFRCDSPNVIRRMEMQISALPQGELEFCSALLSEEAQPYCSLLEPKADRSETLILVCAWCKQVKVRDEWIEMGKAMRALEPFDRPGIPQITHGICPRCSRMFDASY